MLPAPPWPRPPPLCGPPRRALGFPPCRARGEGRALRPPAGLCEVAAVAAGRGVSARRGRARNASGAGGGVAAPRVMKWGSAVSCARRRARGSRGRGGSADLPCWPPCSPACLRAAAAVRGEVTSLKIMSLPGVIFNLGQPHGLLLRGTAQPSGANGRGAGEGSTAALQPQHQAAGQGHVALQPRLASPALDR